MKKRKNRAFVGTAAVTATAVALGGYIAEATQSVAESITCSEVGNNYCSPESAPQSDVRDSELEQAPTDRDRIEGAPVHIGEARILEGPDVVAATGFRR
jgi:hypothetical protein